MKAINDLSLILALIVLTSCVFPNSKETERERKRQRMVEGLDEAKYEELIEEAVEIEILDTTDYSYFEISDDSLDMALFELVSGDGKFTEDLFYKNVETLLLKGADPNAIITSTYSVRKAGTYIPIIKHFYNNKYRKHTEKSSSLHVAVSRGDTKLVEILFDNGGDVNLELPYGATLTDFALYNDDSEMIHFLLDKGADINKVNLGGSTNTDLIEELVKRGANPKKIKLNYALGKLDELKRLIALGADLNETEFDFNILMKDSLLLDLLLNKGLSTEAIGKFPDECPLIFAAIKYENFSALKKLHKKGASLTTECRKGFGDTPLQTAVYYQNVEAMKYLLTNKVSANEKDWTKKSVLMMACNTDNDEVIKTLLDAGAKLEYNGYFSKTPLLHAVEYDKYISANCLIENKANVNYRKKNGMTPLFAAIKRNNFPMIKLLIESGAKTDVKFESKNIVQFAEEEDAAPAVVNYLKKQLGN